MDYSPSYRSTPSAPQTLSRSPEDLIADFAKTDNQRQQFIVDLLRALKTRDRECNELQLELAAQKQSRATYQQQVITLEHNLKAVHQSIERASFVVVLVDGDGAKFLPELLQNPDGGEDAAQRLKQAVRSYLTDLDSKLLEDDPTIFVKIWANLDGLATALQHEGLIHSRDGMRAFARTFSRRVAEFDFIDVGKGKENADSKMRKMLSLYCKNVQCKKIIFAGCHDNGYLHELQEKLDDPEAKKRIVLLETTDAEPRFRQLGFPMTSFPDVFYSQPLKNERKLALNPTPQTVQPAERAPPPQTIAPAVVAVKTAQAERVESPSTSVKSSGNGGISRSYATAGGNVHNENVVIQRGEQSTARFILYNIDHHRLDPPLQSVSPNHPAQDTYHAKLNRTKNRVLCNEHYIAGNCPWGDKCAKNHSVPLTKDEIAIHRFKARTSRCPNGPECEIFDCVLSHHCPYLPTCTRGIKCKFNDTRFGDVHLGKESLRPAYKWFEGEEDWQAL